MDSSATRFKKVARAKAKFREIFERRKNVLLVHYSCESFVENTSGSSRITSIAVRHFDSGQTFSFSLFQVAEALKIKDINTNFELVERELLSKFFECVTSHREDAWVHWNMRDINYGFPALEHRFEILGGKPASIPEANKYDLPRILHERFGPNYTRNHPRLESLVKLNNLTNKDFLNGSQEAEAFNNNFYLKLHQSTLRKVCVFDAILNQIEDGSLKVDSGVLEIYGLSPEGIVKTVTEHWIVSLLTLGSLVGGLIYGIGHYLFGLWPN